MLDEEVEIGALLWANSVVRDFDMLAESGWSGRLRVPAAPKVERALQLLARLKEVKL